METTTKTNEQLIAQFEIAKNWFDTNFGKSNTEDLMMAFNDARAAQTELATRGIEIN